MVHVYPCRLPEVLLCFTIKQLCSLRNYVQFRLSVRGPEVQGFTVQPTLCLRLCSRTHLMCVWLDHCLRDQQCSQRRGLFCSTWTRLVQEDWGFNFKSSQPERQGSWVVVCCDLFHIAPTSRMRSLTQFLFFLYAPICLLWKSAKVNLCNIHMLILSPSSISKIFTIQFRFVGMQWEIFQ